MTDQLALYQSGLWKPSCAFSFDVRSDRIQRSSRGEGNMKKRSRWWHWWWCKI